MVTPFMIGNTNTTILKIYTQMKNKYKHKKAYFVNQILAVYEK